MLHKRFTLVKQLHLTTLKAQSFQIPSKTKTMTPREKIIKLLLKILAHPYRFRRKELAEYIDVDESNLKKYLTAFKNVGLNYEQDSQNRAAILPSSGFEELDRLKSLSEKDRKKIQLALSRFENSKEAMYIMNKIESLYDFQQLGIRALRKPELEKIDQLEAAKKNKVRVILKDYRSNSNEVKDRLVECFHIDPEAGMIQVYDADKKGSRHFKLNRIKRVETTDDPWGSEKNHQYQYTDVFRIADNDRVNVHLLLDVYAYNSLIDTFPQAKGAILEGTKPNTFDFQDRVNHNFLGLTNFIMSNAAHVEILNPPGLKEVIREKAEGILRNI